MNNKSWQTSDSDKQCFPPQDLRNYQYSLPAVEGLRIHMEMGHSYIDIPKSRFSEVGESQEREKTD